MKKILLPIALIALLSIGAITLISKKDLTDSQITVSDWMNCLSTNLSSCADIIDTEDDYKECKQIEREVDIETSPIKCPQFWNFINHAKGDESVNENNLFQSCYFANEKAYQGSYFFYTQIFYPRYHTCSGL